MRIGIFTNAYKPEISGVVTSISTFRDALVDQGHAVYIFAPEAGDYEDDEYGIFRYPAIKLSVPVSFPLAIPVSPFVDWVVPRLKLDILHSQHPVLIGEEAITFAKQLELPHIFTHHSQYEEYSRYVPFNQNIVKSLTREVVRAHMVRSVKIITPSESVKVQLSQQYHEPEHRLGVLPSPINLELYKPHRLNPAPIRQQYGLDQAFTFISVARLTKEKDFPDLLDAFHQATVTFPETRLLLVGDGPVKKDLQKQAQELGIAERVIFAGLIDHKAVPSYLAAADAFAFASTSETQGLVMVEGMAAGLPVVAVDARGNRDVVSDEVNGLLTEDSVSALAAGMKRLIQNPNLCQDYSAGALKTAAGYAPAVLARRLIDIYQQAIDSYAQEPLNYKRFSREHEQSRQFPPHWLTEITGTNAEWVESMTAFWQKLSRYW